MKPNFTNAFFQKTRCLRTVLRRAVVCMLLLGTTVVHAQERKITVDTRQEVTLVQLFRQVEASSDYLFNYKDQDVPTIGVKAVLLASDELSENTVKALTKTLYDGVDTLQAELGLLLELGPADKIGVPVHAGAAAYYQENGMAAGGDAA